MLLESAVLIIVESYESWKTVLNMCIYTAEKVFYLMFNFSFFQ